MAITSYKAVIGYYNSAGTPSITSAVAGQLSGGWHPVGAPILTDSYGQCTQMMVRTDSALTPASGYTVVVGANPQPPDATWNTQGEAIWVDTTTYLQAYIKGSQYTGGVLQPSQGGTGVTDLGQLRRAILVQGVACNDQPGPQAYNSYRSPNGLYTFKVDNSGLVASINSSSESVVPFAVASGGTGAVSIPGARTNLQVDRLGQEGTYTEILSAGNTYRFLVSDTGEWGGFNASTSTWNPLRIAQGGTGSTTAAGARVNLNIARFSEQSTETKILAPNNSTYIYVNNNDWGCFSPALGGAIPLSVARGGTGATTAAGARTNLELDRFKQTTVDTTISDPTGDHTFFLSSNDWGYFDTTTFERVALPVLSGGTGGTTTFEACNSLDALNYNYPGTTSYSSPDLYTGIGFYNSDLSPWPGGDGSPYNYAEIMTVAEGGGGPGGSGNWSQIGFSTITLQAPRYRQRTSNPALITNWRDFLVRDLNTTVDSNGFIKIASPIVKIKSDGSAELNDESEGCVVTRVEKGVYLISGCLGLNSDASWGGINGGFEIPVDLNKQPRIWIDYEVLSDGSIELRTYHRTYPDSPVFARNIIDGISDGEPVDIPLGTYVSVRVEMPSAGK